MKQPSPKKTLGDFQTPCIRSLMRLIQSQSKPTLIRWATGYVTEHILPIYEGAFPKDSRPRDALVNAVGWLEGRVKFADAKETNNGAHTAATAAAAFPAAQAAARAAARAAAHAAAHAALTIHVPAHCLGVAFYGLAALAYAQAGTNAEPTVYAQITAAHCAHMEAALRRIAVEGEPRPAKLDWKLWQYVIGPYE